MSEHDDDTLVTDRAARELCGGVSAMTIWRWERMPGLGFPPPIRINRRKYRKRTLLLRFIREREQVADVDALRERDEAARPAPSDDGRLRAR